MGFNDIDIKVSGGSDIISTLQTYTTRILKPNIVDGKNVLTQEMLSSKNTKYVIKYDYELEEDITVPEGCILEFDGGSINGEHSINFQGLKNTCIYTSWMGVDTLHKSIKYMSYKTLVVDTVLELSTPLTNRGANSLLYFTIKGKEDNNYEWAEGNNKEHSKIICNNCSAIDIFGWCNYVKNLNFTFTSGGNDNPFIILDTQGAEVSDIDSGVYNCSFNTDDHTNPPTFDNINVNNAIVTYGRGLVVQGCLFNGLIKDSYIKCLMKHDNWRPSSGIDVSDKYGGRAFWIHHNRLHMGIARLVHFAVNQSAPDCTFRGIRIENNIADVGGSLGLFDATSYNTVITNNTFLGGVHSRLPFLSIIDGHEIQINNNVFRGYDNEDFPSGLSNEYLITIGSTGDEIKGISICNNIASPRGYFILTYCNIDGINICGNIMSEQAFTASNTALLRALKTTKNAVVKNNINNSPNDAVPAFRAWDTSYPNEGVDNISIADNLGFLNWITSFGPYTSVLNGRSFTNVNIKYDKGVSPDTVMDACSYVVNVRSKTGFSYINTMLYPIRLAIWSGSKWIERDSASLGVVRSGSFASKPSASDIYVGFKYFCTDRQTVEGATNGIEIIHKGNDIWVDALGRVVS